MRRYTYATRANLATTLRTLLTARGLATAAVHEADGFVVVLVPGATALATVRAWERQQPANALLIEEVPDATPNQTPSDTPIYNAIVRSLTLPPI